MTYALFIEKRAQHSMSRIAAQDRDRIADAKAGPGLDSRLVRGAKGESWSFHLSGYRGPSPVSRRLEFYVDDLAVLD